MSEAKNVAGAIAERSRQFEQAYGDADPKALVEAYFAGDDHKPLASPPGGAQPVRGREALTAMFAGLFADMPKIELETIEITASETVASEFGRAILTDVLGARHFGRYCVCWVFTEEGWRAKSDVFGADGWRE